MLRVLLTALVFLVGAPSATAFGQAAFAPWTPANERVDRYDASRFWNATHRGGRVEVGAAWEMIEFTPVGKVWDPAVHNGRVVDNHYGAALDFTLWESVRVRVGGGATVSRLRGNRDGLNEDDPLRGFREFTGGHYRFGISWGPQFRWVPRQVFTPILEFELVGHEAGHGSLGSLHANVVRLNVLLHWEAFRDYQTMTGIGIFIGVGYHHYFGWYTRPDGTSLNFSSPGGGGADFQWGEFGGDVDIIIGATAVIADHALIRVEAYSGMPSIRVLLAFVGP